MQIRDESTRNACQLDKFYQLGETKPQQVLNYSILAKAHEWQIRPKSEPLS